PRIAEMSHPRQACDPMDARTGEMIRPRLRERNQPVKLALRRDIERGTNGARQPYPRRIRKIAEYRGDPPQHAHGEPLFRRRPPLQLQPLRRTATVAAEPVRPAWPRTHTDDRRLPAARCELAEHTRHLHAARSIHWRHLPGDR